jgi:hypothetical protein
VAADGPFDGLAKVGRVGPGRLAGISPGGFPGPPAAPGVRLSAHRALHVPCPLG